MLRLWRELRRDTVWWGLLAIILALGLGLNLYGVGWGLPYQLEPDEPYYFLLGRLLRVAGTGEGLGGGGYPIGYPLIQMAVQLVTLIASEGKFPQSAHFLLMRVLGALVTVINAGLAAHLARRVAGVGAGLLAAAFLVVNPTLVDNAHRARPDAWHTLFTLLAVLMLLRAAWDDRPRDYLWSLAFALVAATMKPQAAALWPAPVLLCLAHPMPRRRKLGTLAVLAGLLIMGLWTMFSPTRVVSMFHMPSTPFGELERGLQAGRVPVSWRSVAENWGAVYDALLEWPTFAILAGGGAPLLARARSLRRSDWALLLAWAVYLTAYTAAMATSDFIGVRQWLPVVTLGGALWGTAAWSLIVFVSRWMVGAMSRARVPAIPIHVDGISSALAVALCLPLITPARLAYDQDRRISQPDTRAIVANWFKANVPAGPIAIEYDGVQFMRDYGGYRGEKDFPVKVVTSLFDLTLAELEKDGIRYLVADERAGSRGGYYSDPTNSEFSSRVVRLLALENVNLQGPRLTVFRLGAIQHPLDVTLGGLVALEGYDASSSGLRPGDALRLTLYWRRLGPIATDYTVFTHVLDAQGNLVAGKDNPSAGGARPTTTWTLDGETIVDDYVILLPATLDAGTYSVEIGMYDPVSGDRLRPDAPEGASSVVLGEIEIR